jgi:hypothetical protein
MSVTGLAALSANAWAQPPLPPTARGHDVGVVFQLKPGESIRLYTGALALLSDDVKVSGPFESVMEGDLVELAYDSLGVVSEITLLPHLPQLQPLTELHVEDGAAYQTYWRRDEAAYPNSLRSADVQFRLSGTALQLTGEAVYEPLDPEARPAVFRILDHRDTVLWEQQLAPSEAAPFRCSIRGVSRLRLRCTGPEDESVNPYACVWLSPALVLRQMEYAPIRPELSDRLVEDLANGLADLKPGTVCIGMPEVIGVADDMARDLRDDLFVAAAGRLAVVGALPKTTSWPPNDKDRAAAEAMGATSILVSRIHYRATGTQISAALLTTAYNEALASAEVALEQHARSLAAAPIP